MNARKLLFLGLVACSLGACATTPVERQKQTTESLADMRDGMLAAQQQIDKTLSSLNSLVSAPPDKLPEAYQQYARDVDTLKKQTDQVQKSREQMRRGRDQWLAGWQDAQTKVQNPELKEIAQERRSEVAERFDRVGNAFQTASEAFTPFIQNLDDVKTVVGNDLSQRGIDAVSRTNVIQNATTNGAAEEHNLEAAVKEFDELLGTLYPARK